MRRYVCNLSTRFRTPSGVRRTALPVPVTAFWLSATKSSKRRWLGARFFEAYAYRRLFKEYFTQGAKWTAAPRPQLLDDLYDNAYRPPRKDEPLRYIVNDFEPVFDAADFVRCGRDLFCIRTM